MQIGHYKHISFPGTGLPPAATNASDDSDDAAPGTPVGARGAPVRQTPPPQSAPGVIATIQSDGTGNAADSVAPDLVYADPRKAAQTVDSKSQDFVTFAVHAMREYADEQARQKTENTTADSSATPLIPRSMGDVQKLAARFKLFT